MLQRLNQAGIVVLASAGNYGDDTATTTQPDGNGNQVPINQARNKLDTYTPRKHGGTNTPLIVVGGAQWNGSMWDLTNRNYEGANTGILSILNYGERTVCASNTNAGNTGTGVYLGQPGTSPATAGIAGLTGYVGLSCPAMAIIVRKREALTSRNKTVHCQNCLSQCLV